MTLRPFLVLALALVATGCGRSELDPRPEDGGRRLDGGNPDGGRSDGGNPDGGRADGGGLDGGNPDAGCETWRATGTLPWDTSNAKAVALPSGRVLVAGGSFSAQDAALYDPATGVFTRRSVDDSAELLRRMRGAIITRG